MEKGTQLKMRDYYRTVFNNTAEGKLVLADILERGGVGQGLFAIDQLAQNRNVSRHDFAVEIADMVKPERDK
jgi:hypothetical protein